MIVVDIVGVGGVGGVGVVITKMGAYPSTSTWAIPTEGSTAPPMLIRASRTPRMEACQSLPKKEVEEMTDDYCSAP